MSCLAAETPDVLNATSNIDGALDRTRDLCFRFQVARSLARSLACFRSDILGFGDVAGGDRGVM